MKALALAALAVAALVVARTNTSNTDAADPARTLEAVRMASPPVLDAAELRSRVVSPGGSPQAEPTADAFWVLDLVQRVYRLVPVELRHTSPHAEWFVERARDGGDLPAAARFFETRTLPRLQELLGSTWTPGSNGQPRIAVFNGQTPGVAGYMSASDALPRSVFPHSNERPIVYLNLDAVHPGTSSYNAALAHELEHLLHFMVNPTQEGWLDEGLADLAMSLVMEAPVPSASRFRARSNVQLTAWSENPSETRAHYEASHLWARYLMERGGGAAALADLLRVGGRGLETADRFARLRGLDGGVDGLFRDWLLANLVGDRSYGDGRYGYSGTDHRSAPAGSLSPGGGVTEDRVHQFAANYYELQVNRPANLRVEVDPTVLVIAADGVDGAMYWSLRGDNLDTRLTRDFQLAGVERATLRYRVWHDLEAEYDFCYTLGSADGLTWFTLPGRHTTDRNTLGVALGHGYTGASGSEPGWLDEEVDLTPFAGGQAYVRYECVTDQGYSGPGFAVDNVEIPEIGFADDASADRGWAAEGFARVGNQMAPVAAVLVVEIGAGRLVVREVLLDRDGRGSLSLGGPASGVERSYAVVAGLAPATLEQMGYRLWLE